MAKATRTKEQVFANTREMLEMAEHGFAQATGSNPGQRRAGLMNLFTYGRSVTLTIQTMKSVEPDFEEWWKSYQDKMKADPLMQYFNETRTDIIHEGKLSVHTSTVIGANGPVNLGAIMRELSRYAPPNTVRTFFGEGRTGGNGWDVKMPDGSIQKVYFDLPGTFDVKSELHLSNPPKEHDGRPIADTSIANIGKLYLDTLRGVVADFEARFKLLVKWCGRE